jgi:MoaD family protein
MEVRVRFFTSLREIVNKREEILSFGSGELVTLDVVLGMLSKKYGSAFVEYVYNQKTGAPRGFLQFLVNGTSITTLKGFQTPLRDGDVLAILPPVGGG